jgi:hypothetical protein
MSLMVAAYCPGMLVSTRLADYPRGPAKMAMQEHVLAPAQLIGSYEKKGS